MRPAIEVRDWCVRYPEGDPVLAHCAFTLRYGEFTVLSGLSGEGKTTLLSSMSGVIPNAVPAETTGKILVDGTDIAGAPMTEIARRVGSVLQNPDSQIFHSRVGDEIAFGCETSTCRRRRSPAESAGAANASVWKRTHLPGPCPQAKNSG